MSVAEPVVATSNFSWDLIEQNTDTLKGPLSRDFGFMPAPDRITEASVQLPPNWMALWKTLPEHYINQTLRNCCEGGRLEPIDVEQLHETLDSLSFLKTKSVVFNIAQAWVDSHRVIGDTDVMPEPPALPTLIAEAVAAFSDICDCPDYCTLADICLTSAEVLGDSFEPLTAHFDEMRLVCPVNGAPTEEEKANGDLEPSRVRGVVENRFHLMPTIMEYRASDLPALVADIQKLLHQHEMIDHPQCREGIESALVEKLQTVRETFVRLRESMTFLRRETVDPVVWHRDVVKFTAGYGGHKGSSGPQTPIIHLIDVFLGRSAYTSELGEIILQVREQLQHNHQFFIRSVEEGPSIRQFCEQLGEADPEHKVVKAFQATVQEYVKGFLAIHHGKAVSYANAGFGETDTPRIFTAGTQYDWPSTKTVTNKLGTMFNDATSERAEILSGGGCPVDHSSSETALFPPGMQCPMGHR